MVEDRRARLQGVDHGHVDREQHEERHDERAPRSGPLARPAHAVERGRSGVSHSAPCVRGRGTGRATGRADEEQQHGTVACRPMSLSMNEFLAVDQVGHGRRASPLGSARRSAGRPRRRSGMPGTVSTTDGNRMRRRQHRQRDVGEPPPPTGTVDERALVQVAGDALQPGRHDDEREPEVGPDADDRQRRAAPSVRIAAAGRAPSAPGRCQDAGQDADLRLQQDEPHQRGHGDGRGDRRREHRAEEAASLAGACRRARRGRCRAPGRSAR